MLKVGKRFEFKDYEEDDFSGVLMDTGEVIVWWYLYEFSMQTIFYDIKEVEEMFEDGQWIMK